MFLHGVFGLICLVGFSANAKLAYKVISVVTGWKILGLIGTAIVIIIYLNTMTEDFWLLVFFSLWGIIIAVYLDKQGTHDFF